MTEPLISVILPNHNSGQLLRRCLTSLANQVIEHPCEVIVVDDGSTDAGADCVREFPGTILLKQQNKGAAVARNRGIEAAHGRFICFLDSDCRAQPQWLDEITSPLIGGEAQVTVGRFISSQTGLLPRLIQQEIEGRLERMRRFEQVDFLNSATCGFRREVLESFRFDSSFQKLEDIELSFRLAEAGVPILYIPTAVVDHFHPVSLGHYLGRKFKYGSWAPSLYRRFPARASETRARRFNDDSNWALSRWVWWPCPFQPFWVPLSSCWVYSRRSLQQLGHGESRLCSPCSIHSSLWLEASLFWLELWPGGWHRVSQASIGHPELRKSVEAMSEQAREAA